MTKKDDRPDTALDLVRKIRFETLGRSSFLISIINATLTYFVLREVANPTRLTLWLSVLVTITVIRAILVSVFWRLDQKGAHVSLWTTFYLLTIYISALCWGVLPLFPAFTATNWSESLIVFLVAGMSAGGLISLFPLLRAAIPYFILILLPLIVTLGSMEERSYLIMAGFAVLYLFFLIRSAFILNRVVKTSINLEIENENLFDFLTEVRNGEFGSSFPGSGKELNKNNVPAPQE